MVDNLGKWFVGIERRRIRNAGVVGVWLGVLGVVAGASSASAMSQGNVPNMPTHFMNGSNPPLSYNKMPPRTVAHQRWLAHQQQMRRNAYRRAQAPRA